MSAPTEHKTVQVRILAYAGLRRPVAYEGQAAILLRAGYGGQVGWTFVSQKEAAVCVSRRRRAKDSCRRVLNRREHRDRKEDLDSGSLCSLRSLRYFISATTCGRIRTPFEVS